jgi:predicted ATPase
VGVKGIPALAQALDPEVLPVVLRRLFDLMRIEVERVEGRVSLITGDGLRALFGAPIAEDEPLLSHLLGIPPDAEPLPTLSPEVWKRRLQQACQQVILQQAAERPLCLLIEDGHWLDSSSQELLDLLVLSLVSRPILLLVTARPGFRHTWDDLTSFHRLTVEPLAAAHTDALIRQYFQPHDVSPALKALIRDRTGGTPFFVEEILRALEEQALLTLRDDGYALQAGVQLDIPSSVHGVLAARLDRLPAAQKRLLQTASVLGMEVPLSLLEAVAGEPEDVLERGLLHLQAAEFLYAAGHRPNVSDHGVNPLKINGLIS